MLHELLLFAVPDERQIQISASFRTKRVEFCIRFSRVTDLLPVHLGTQVKRSLGDPMKSEHQGKLVNLSTVGICARRLVAVVCRNFETTRPLIVRMSCAIRTCSRACSWIVRFWVQKSARSPSPHAPTPALPHAELC